MMDGIEDAVEAASRGFTDADVTHPAPLARKRNGVKEIIAFWRETSDGDLGSVTAKLQAYGALDSHAYQMLTLVGRPHASLREGTEIAIASYVAGKLNRIMESLALGLLPTEDCWDDLARYAMMARYVRKFGRWP